MSPQSGTAMQLAKAAVPLKDPTTLDVLDRMRQTYDAIARRAFEIFDNNGRWCMYGRLAWVILFRSGRAAAPCLP